jgi:hypothetical protein
MTATLLTLWVLGAPASAHVTVTHQVSAFTSLVHLLQCRAEATSCTRDAYEAWSNTALGWSTADGERLATLRALTSRYAVVAEFADDPGPPGGFPIHCATGWNAQDKMRVASWEAQDVPDLERRLAAVMRPSDAAQYAAAVAHFWPRYRAAVAPFTRALEAQAAASDALVRTPAMDALIQQAFRFYAPALQGEVPLVVHLVPRPRAPHEPQQGGVATRATVVERHAMVEAVADERPEERVDVVLHELFHFFLEQRTNAQHAALLKAFADSGDPQAMGLYAIMDEALAAALGNGLVLEAARGPEVARKAWAREGGLYNEFFIDRVGTALIGLLRTWLAEGTVLGPAVVPAYLAAAREALGTRVDAIPLLLKSRNILYRHPGQQSVARAINRVFRGISTDVEPDRPVFASERHRLLSAVVVARPADLEGWKAHPGVVGAATLGLGAKAVVGARAVVVGERRSPQADTYLVVCHEDADCLTAWKMAVERDHRFEGVGVRWLPE